MKIEKKKVNRIVYYTFYFIIFMLPACNCPCPPCTPPGLSNGTTTIQEYKYYAGFFWDIELGTSLPASWRDSYNEKVEYMKNKVFYPQMNADETIYKFR